MVRFKIGPIHSVAVFNTTKTLKTPVLQVDQKRPDARRPKSTGVTRTVQYVATTWDEGNAADGRFSSTC